MSTFIFLRHGHSSANAADLLTGRLPGVALSKKGQQQANELAERIGSHHIDYLHISPIERCQLTIDPWLRSRYSKSIVKMAIEDGVSEIDFGQWSGRKLSSLRRLPLWKDVQNKPSKVTFPQGESFRHAQRRAVASVEKMMAQRGEKTHLIVSHSDVIKLISAHYLAMKLDEFQKINISPASFTIFTERKGTVSLHTLNNSGTLKELLS